MALSDLSSRDAVLQAMREFDALGRDAFLAKHGFGRARQYVVVGPDGRTYDSKAIAGVAHGIQFQHLGTLPASTFSGGEATVEAKLSALGFDVVRGHENWSLEEVRIIVADYFEMLSLQRADKSYVKAQRIRNLLPKLNGRSAKSVEYKYRNISAVLEQVGIPIVDGFAPATNIQSLLRDEVLIRLDEAVIAVESGKIAPTEPLSTSGLEVARPVAISVPAPADRVAIRKIDWATRDASNRKLGRDGESWCVQFERLRLTEGGRADLAAKVEHLSEDRGDGAGYDIHSFELDGSQRCIEVKTTFADIDAAFFVSDNELATSARLGNAFRLYRVFSFGKNPRMYVLQGDLRDHLELRPTGYRAFLK